MISDSFSAHPIRIEAMTRPVDSTAALVHPHQLAVQEFASYALVIDARSPHEFAQDHIPGAVNLPVVDDEEFAEVGIRHKTDTHGAYLIGVDYSLRNIADQIKPLISRYTPQDRFLVYCFRGGKRSRLRAKLEIERHLADIGQNGRLARVEATPCPREQALRIAERER